MEEESLNNNFKTLWRAYQKFIVAVLQQENKNFVLADNISEGKLRHSLCNPLTRNLICLYCSIMYYIFFSDEAFVRILLEIPTLFKVRALPKSPLASKTSKCWRPSLTEIKNAFCLHVKVSIVLSSA